MFHTYVRATSGNTVDFDRATFLMDRDLLGATLDALREVRDGWDTDRAAQWVWDQYCARHREVYGEGFVADLDPEWDR
jgi:hypothetical protein